MIAVVDEEVLVLTIFIVSKGFDYEGPFGAIALT